MTVNQGEYGLLLSHADGVTTRYTYDAAGRLVKEDNKTYRYGYLDKVMSVTEGDRTYTYTYHADGQLASASCDGIGRAGAPRTAQTETFLWDGLALIQRGDEQFVNEPNVGNAPKKLRFEGKPRSARRARKGPRGNPVVSSKGVSYFNDMLGTTLGKKEKGCKYSAAALSVFGERLDNVDGTSLAIRSLGEGWFTGKPFVEGLGHTFLFRNYRANLGKWQTADPIGYPDGWNQLAYCGNGVVSSVDIYGAERFDRAWRVILSHWLGGSGDELDLFHDGYFSDYMNANALLNNSIRSWLLTYAYGHSAGLINMRRHAEIENGYYTGYELLHGSNGEVGDFEMWGGFTTERQGDYLLYHFNITCQWNDKIDPNYSYNSDADLETFIRLFGFPFPYFSPADYVIRIRWNKKLTIKVLYE